jgi:23S rRNA pseudouridine1911/1915/1917 synthase
MRELIVDPNSVGLRLDVFVASHYPQYTRASLEPLFDRGMVYLNSETAKPGSRLRAGSKVRIDESLLLAKPKPIKLPVIYEDEDVVVVNKPAGVLTHSKGALNVEATVASFLAGKITDKSLTGNRAGIVHRLDRATSGLIIGAKTFDAQKFLQKQFSTRRTLKTYLAIVEGWPKPETAVVDAPLERNPKKPQTFRVGASGKTAKTSYKTIERFSRNGQNYALLDISPFTGRTHQIRVHLSYIGHPVVGDKLYGRSDSDYLYLHSHKLQITLPKGQIKAFIAPAPQSFKDFESGK